jgi:L-seryl-tRNA(Ser) seleniumtransferase
MHRFLEEPVLAAHIALSGTTVVKAAVDAVLARARAHVAEGGEVPPFEALVEAACTRLEREASEQLTGVVNATGILLHTNLGRAPLAREALTAIGNVAGGYSNLEFDLGAGARGSRYERTGGLLRAVTGAEASLVVNNCAAAVLLILDTFARAPAGSPGREVVVARNGLIEIGGGFRLPEVLARSGATLVEAGTTNRVYLRDFERALSARTALFLRSHASNFRLEGFTADVSGAELAGLARRSGVLAVEDLGSGALVDLGAFGLPHERTVPEAVADGLDLIAFSGDKLLGGPQAGIIVGRAAPIARLRANPLLRALRVDKATLAALGATLQLYLEPEGRGVRKIPLYAMLAATVDALRVRAERLASGLPGRWAVPVATDARAGGGSAPGAVLPSFGLEVRDPAGRPSDLAARLRCGRPRVVARVADDAVVLDLRTVPPELDGELGRALAGALGAPPG